MLIKDNYLFAGNVTEEEGEENVLGMETSMGNFRQQGDYIQICNYFAFPALSRWTDTFVPGICAIVCS